MHAYCKLLADENPPTQNPDTLTKEKTTAKRAIVNIKPFFLIHALNITSIFYDVNLG